MPPTQMNKGKQSGKDNKLLCDITLCKINSNISSIMKTKEKIAQLTWCGFRKLREYGECTASHHFPSHHYLRFFNKHRLLLGVS